MLQTKRFLAAIVMVLAVLTVARAQTTAVGRATGVKVLLVGDTNEFPNGDVASDVNAMKRYLSGLPGFDSDRDMKVLTGDDVSAENILQAVDDLDVQPTDALFVFFDGHGAYDPNLAAGDPAGGHHLQIRSGDLLRADLMDRLLAKGARLTVLITETCNGVAQFSPHGHQLREAAPEMEPVVSASLETLLYDFTGVVDVNAASQGESSWSSPDGGWFTQSLLRTLDENDQVLQQNSALPGVHDADRPAGEQTLSWQDFLARAAVKTHAVFQEHRDAAQAAPEPVDEGQKAARQELLSQEDEQPEVFQLDVQPATAAVADDNTVPPPPSNDFPPPLNGFPFPGK